MASTQQKTVLEERALQYLREYIETHCNDNIKNNDYVLDKWLDLHFGGMKHTTFQFNAEETTEALNYNRKNDEDFDFEDIKLPRDVAYITNNYLRNVINSNEMFPHIEVPVEDILSGKVSVELEDYL